MEPCPSSLDLEWMLKAVELSQRGWPTPNPRVGCVLVKDGRLISEGWHQAAGGPHAEAVALASAGERSKGSTAYVTLEPCAHFGRTPPCAQALIQAGVQRVVYAVPDPNPTAAGGGKVLHEAGVQTACGIGREEAVLANQWWLYQRFLGRPVVILKAALTQDGFMARLDGTSKWITSLESRQLGHRLRAEMGAVLTGWRTVQIDQPLLTARIPGVVNQPKRVILDPHGRLTGKEAALQGEEAIWVRAFGSSDDRILIPPVEAGNLDLDHLLTGLAERDCMGLLVEGGPATLQTFLQADLWDELHIFLGPGEFGEGNPAPDYLRQAAAQDDAPIGLSRQEEAVGKDRHIVLTKRETILGTIARGLQSIGSDTVFYPSP